MAEEALKAEKDFSKQVNELLSTAKELTQSDLQAAVERLTSLEKQTRQASDPASTTRILIAKSLHSSD
jgi:26S proteasome regulatory subunit N5